MQVRVPSLSQALLHAEELGPGGLASTAEVPGAGGHGAECLVKELPLGTAWALAQSEGQDTSIVINEYFDHYFPLAASVGANLGTPRKVAPTCGLIDRSCAFGAASPLARPNAKQRSPLTPAVDSP